MMGKLTWSINVTLDGCCDHTQVIADAEFHAYQAEVLDQAACLLLGRASYQLLESYWPAVARGEVGDLNDTIVAFARQLDAKRKYVASGTLDKVGWNASLLEGDAVAAVSRLKDNEGDILIDGSPGLGATLTHAGLIDEHHFVIQPIAAGRGPRLFEGVSVESFALLGTRAFSSGVVLARYSNVM
jgi:dihydrofolate reductase